MSLLLLPDEQLMAASELWKPAKIDVERTLIPAPVFAECVRKTDK